MEMIARREARVEAEARPAAGAASRPSAQSACVVAALFTAGVAVFSGAPRPEPKAAAPVPAIPSPEFRAQADGSVLVPFAPETRVAPQYEDGLVPFSLNAPIIEEGPAFAPQRGIAFRMPQLEAETAIAADSPLVEQGRARAEFRPVSIFGVVPTAAKSPRQSLDERAARGAALWAAMRAAIAAVAGAAPAAANAAEDPAREFYRKLVELNGGYTYTQDDTNDFAPGYKVCDLKGFRCRPQTEGMLIETPEGAKVSHRYNRGGFPRNAIFVTLPGAAAAQDISHCPLVFDLGGKGVRTSNQPVRYDVDGRGRIALIHDVASHTGVLAFDVDGDGIAGATGRELFGDGTDLDGNGVPDGHLDGFDALDSFVRRAEKAGVILAGTADSGLLTASDLARLHARYGLSLRLGSLKGRAVSPADAGVREIRLSTARSVRTENFDAQLNDVVRRHGAVFAHADGSTGAYEDVFFRYDRPNLQPVAFAR
ncbi:MAG: hypothetical protein HY553_23075 [Elusimicrobia bacterium]|nr:hypothetical protein [Elusimicrobiota bacterium]